MIKTPLFVHAISYSLEVHFAVVLLSGISTVVDECESGRSATSILNFNTEDSDVLILGLQELGKLGLDLSFRDVSNVGVDHLEDLLYYH